MDKYTVLILTRKDLIERFKVSFENVALHYFMLDVGLDRIHKADFIVFIEDDGRNKVLKSRNDNLIFQSKER